MWQFFSFLSVAHNQYFVTTGFHYFSFFIYFLPRFFVGRPKFFLTAPNQHHSFGTCSGEPGNTGPSPFPGALSHIHSKTACRGFKSFCPCHKTGGNSGFLPVFFFHVLHGFGVHLGSDTGFSHQVLSVSNRSHPLQHPKRTRFRLFRAFPGAFFSFSLLSGRKIFMPVFVHPAA